MIALVVGVMVGSSLAWMSGGASGVGDAGSGGSGVEGSGSGAEAGAGVSPMKGLRAGGDKTGLWVAVHEAGGNWRLLHRTADQGEGALRAAIHKLGPIVHLAGGGERCFALFSDGTVQSVERRRDERRGTTSYERGQFPPLPRVARIVDAAGSGGRLQVLVDMGGEGASTDASADPSTGAGEGEAAAGAGSERAPGGASPSGGAGEAGGERAGLWVIDSSGSEWGWTRGPGGLASGARARLVPTGGGATIVAGSGAEGRGDVGGEDVVGDAEAEGGANGDAAGERGLTVYRYEGGVWVEQRYAVSAGADWSVGRAVGEVFVVGGVGSGAGPGVTVLSGSSAMEGGRLPWPGGETAGWAATGYGDRASLVVGQADGGLWLASRDLTKSAEAEGALVALGVEPEPAPPINEQVVFWGLLALAILSVLAVRRMDRAGAAVVLPEGLMPAPTGRRLAGLLIDLVPGVGASMAVFGIADPWAVVTPWLALSSNAAELAPGVGAIVLTAGHCMIVEGLIGSSIGKRLVGLRVVDVKGGRIDWRSAMLRNLMKMIELLLWPLALFSLLNPAHQRMGDLIGRTIVVITIEPAEASGSAERGGEGGESEEAERGDGEARPRPEDEGRREDEGDEEREGGGVGRGGG